MNIKESVSKALKNDINTYWQVCSQGFRQKNEPKSFEYALVKKAKIWQVVSMLFHSH
jgi:hypothetical protein